MTEAAEPKRGPAEPGLRGPWRFLADPRLASALAVVFGVVLIGRTVWENRPAAPPAGATAVAEGRVTETGTTRKPATVIVRVDYAFRVGRKTYDGFAAREVTPARAAEWAPPPADATVTVRYDPTDPEINGLEGFAPGGPLHQEPELLIGAGLIILGLLYGLGTRGTRESPPPLAA